ncbi:MAG: CPBP family intramembrane glutamic endopeptidase, partial [Maioricimonas sp. JB049]
DRTKSPVDQPPSRSAAPAAGAPQREEMFVSDQTPRLQDLPSMQGDVERPGEQSGAMEHRASRPPGPGLPESVLWAGAIVVLQIVIAIPLMIGLAVRAGGDWMDVNGPLDEMGPNGRMLMFGLPTLLAFVLLAVPILWRLGRRPTATLNLSLPNATQLAIVVSTVLPLSLIADGLYWAANEQWQALVEQIPLFEVLEGASVMETLDAQVKGASVLVLLLFIAVVPAVGEELVFRGLIGRGLVARWGVAMGVLLTSVLFAVVHMYPPHVAAIFPVGMVIHLVYLATRSFWMPVLFHFVNNASAVLVLSSGAPLESEPQPLLVAAAVVYVLIALWLLWRYRTQYLAEDGETFSPRYVTVAEPLPESGYRRSTPQSVSVAAVFGLLFVAQAVLATVDVMGAMEG